VRVAAVLAVAFLALAGEAAGALRLERIGTFREPVYVTGVGERLFVVERRGRIRVVHRGRIRRRPFLDISREVLIRSPYETVDQRGLLSVAFAPDYAASGRFYVFFVDRRNRIRIDELHRSDRSARRTLLALPGAGPVHHGGQLAFGPDGALYASIGFGDRAGAPQDPGSLRGKIVRFENDVPQVWASGLRNPYRFSFAPDGRMVVADVGGDDAEEVTVLDGPGANLGWPVFEGDGRQEPGTVDGYVAPVLSHSHRAGWCSIVGGYVVGGRYFYGDVCSGRVHAARLGGATRRVGSIPYLVSFGLDARRRLYAVSFRGPVWRIASD
jgi:glucose/arabinose dehydrogenase